MCCYTAAVLSGIEKESVNSLSPGGCGYDFKCVNFQLNSPSVTYMCQWIRSALVQIMACHLFAAKPLSEPTQTYCQLEPKEHISMRVYLKWKYFHSRKCVWICRLRNGSHFVREEMSQLIVPWRMWLWFQTCKSLTQLGYSYLQYSSKHYLEKMPQDFDDIKSTMIHIIAWWHQAWSHYLNQCWPISLDAMIWSHQATMN